MTLNGLMAVILRYFSELGYLSGVLRKSSRSLSRLLMRSCTFGACELATDFKLGVHIDTDQYWRARDRLHQSGLSRVTRPSYIFGQAFVLER